MRVRHEVLLDDIGIRSAPKSVISLSLGEFPDHRVDCIAISNYDELTDEDLPSLLIRQDVDADIDNALLHAIGSFGYDRLPLDYSDDRNPVPAIRSIPRRVFGRTDRAFRKTYAEWADTIARLDKDLSLNAARIINLIKWRFGIFGSREVLANRVLLTFTTQSEWAVILRSRDDFFLSFWDSNAADLSDSMANELQALLDQGKHEPLTRDLLREASLQIETNPRSALVVGVSAAEVGLKRFLTQYLPPWSRPLVVDAPQVPVLTMLRNILPNLVEETLAFPDPKLPSKSVVAPIHEAASMRNVAVHQPPDSAKAAELAEYLDSRKHVTALLAVSDLLYFLDFFSGEDWALERVSKASRENWIKRNPSPDPARS